jgi:hypothetical protein
MKAKPAMAVLIAALLAGCASTSVNMDSSRAPWVGSTPAMGSSYSGGVVYVNADANGYFALLYMGVIAIGMHDDLLSGAPASRSGAPPPLDEGRSVVERDCSKPMDATSGNLRCR